MARRSLDPNIVNSLRQALLLRPSDSQAKSQVILTSAPHLWDDADLPPGTVVVDVQEAFGFRSTWTPFDSDLELAVLHQFLRAGWPADRVRAQYRPGRKTRFRIDLALLDPTGELLVAVELKHRRALSPGLIEELAQLVFARTPARWACVTDGATYWLRRREDRSSAVLKGPPSPVDLGACQPKDRAVTAAGMPVLCPDDVGGLEAAAVQVNPDALVMDFTLPFGFRVAQDSPARALVETKVSRMPNGPVDLIELLLAWAATLSTVRLIAAIMPPVVAFGERCPWLREHVNHHLPLLAHLSLPSGTFQPATGVGAALMLLGGDRKEVFIHSLGSPGDLLKLPKQEWWQSLSRWLRGSAAPDDYLAERSDLEGWRLSPGTPQIKRVAEKLETLASVRRLGELCDVFVGLRVAKVTDVLSDDARRGHPFLRAADLRHWATDRRSEEYVPSQADIPERYRLQPGDLLMSRTMTERGQIVVNPDVVVISP